MEKVKTYINENQKVCYAYKLQTLEDEVSYHTNSIGDYVQVCFKMSMCPKLYYKDNCVWLNGVENTIKAQVGDYLVYKNGMILFIKHKNFIKEYELVTDKEIN